METKELKIQVPEGYEIDKENSTFECIKFKSIRNDITYKDICKKLFGKGYYYFGDRGEIREIVEFDDKTYTDRNNAAYIKQLDKVLALNQLLNIAEYYNKQNPKQGDYPYCITLDEVHEYQEGAYDLSYTSFGLVALFNRKEDAQAVINNPNFREILDAVYKDLR